MLPIAVYMLRSAGNCESYQQKLNKCLTKQPHESDKLVNQNWEALKSGIVSAAEAAIGRGRSKQPDWFLDAADTLQPLLEEKNVSYNHFLRFNSVSAKKEFRRRQRIVKSAVDAAKEQWISKVAGKAGKAKKDGRQRWTCVRQQLQMAEKGRRLKRPVTLMKESGELASNPR